MDLTIAAIAKAENIEVTDEDVEAEFQKRSEEFKIDVEKLKKYLGEPMVREQLLRDRAIAVVVENAVPVKPDTEKPAEEDAQ